MLAFAAAGNLLASLPARSDAIDEKGDRFVIARKAAGSGTEL